MKINSISNTMPVMTNKNQNKASLNNQTNLQNPNFGVCKLSDHLTEALTKAAKVEDGVSSIRIAVHANRLLKLLKEVCTKVSNPKQANVELDGKFIDNSFVFIAVSDKGEIIDCSTKYENHRIFNAQEKPTLSNMIDENIGFYGDENGNFLQKIEDLLKRAQDLATYKVNNTFLSLEEISKIDEKHDLMKNPQILTEKVLSFQEAEKLKNSTNK